MIRVYADAVADLFHWGHAEFFRQARALGDVLVVGVHDDVTVTSYKRAPILTMEERVRAVRSCRWVDEVVPSAPLIVDDQWLDEFRIDVVVHADDLPPERAAEWYGAAIARGAYRTIAYNAGISTTEIIDRIRTRM